MPVTQPTGEVPPLPIDVDHDLHLDESGIESAKYDLHAWAVSPATVRIATRSSNC